VLVSAGFSKDNSAPSRIIRDVTGAPCSHAFLILDVAEFGQEVVWEASAFGLRQITLARFLAANTLVDRVSFGTALQPGIRWAIDELGDRYSFLKLFGMGVVYAGRALKKKWDNPAHSAHSMFCSELVTTVLQKSGVPAVVGLVPEDTSPGDLLAVLQRSVS
jgi:hypothetical protein